MANNEKLIKIVRDNIRSYADFPKPGIIFRDIFSVLKVPEAFKILQELLVQRVKLKAPDAVIGLESRGFLLGPIIALQLGLPFVPIRKKGKLPGKIKQLSYTIEYGEDTFEIQTDGLQKGQNVVLVDDLLATGGSLRAACTLVNQLGAKVVECLVVMELKDLNGQENIPVPVHSIVQF
ncbi:adenine phosphoribosyltransferase [Anabrus simplex]|uniref:adenine phosphoribosyltransferase n=1 Tax=Anabrus simplex TaxID=316456 RepID=UPI0034DDB318